MGGLCSRPDASLVAETGVRRTRLSSSCECREQHAHAVSDRLNCRIGSSRSFLPPWIQ